MQASRSPDELPTPSAELVLLRTGAQAVIRALGRKRGEKFLKEWSALLMTVETVDTLMPVRPRSDREAVSQAKREALMWFRSVLPYLLDTMPPE